MQSQVFAEQLRKGSVGASDTSRRRLPYFLAAGQAFSPGRIETDLYLLVWLAASLPRALNPAVSTVILTASDSAVSGAAGQ